MHWPPAPPLCSKCTARCSRMPGPQPRTRAAAASRATAGVRVVAAAPAPRRARRGRPGDCGTISDLKALVASESKRQGLAWHAAALSQLSRLAGPAPTGGGGGGAVSSRAAAARRDAEALAVRIASAVQNGLARAGPEDLATAATALASARGLGNTRPALQAAARALEAAALPAAAPGGGAGGGGVDGWGAARLAAAARGLAALADAGEDAGGAAAAAGAVAGACCRIAGSDEGVSAEVGGRALACARVRMRQLGLPTAYLVHMRALPL